MSLYQCFINVFPSSAQFYCHVGCMSVLLEDEKVPKAEYTASNLEFILSPLVVYKQMLYNFSVLKKILGMRGEI